jgi:hypothetical protein
VVSRLVEGAFGIAAAVLIVIIARTRMTGADRQPAVDGDGPPGSPGSPAEDGDVDASPGLDRLSSV